MANVQDTDQVLYNENLRVLSRVIASEAGDEQGHDAQLLVGWAVINRMKQKGKNVLKMLFIGSLFKQNQKQIQLWGLHAIYWMERCPILVKV